MIIGFSEINFDKQISKGSFSVVFKGTYKFLPVALKRISLHNLSIKQVNGMLNELLILNRLKHPNIILVIGFTIDDDKNFYIVSELYPKKHLKIYLEENNVCM